MNKNGLFVLNMGLLMMMLSAVGEGMTINYLTLISGLFIVGMGAIMIFRKKNSRKK